MLRCAKLTLMHISCSICPTVVHINHFLVPPILRLKLSYSRSQLSVCFLLLYYLAESVWVKEDELSLGMTIVLNPSEWLSASA